MDDEGAGHPGLDDQPVQVVRRGRSGPEAQLEHRVLGAARHADEPGAVEGGHERRRLDPPQDISVR